MTKRSPRYPRHGLSKAIEMTRKLFEGAHQSKVDSDTAARVIGYSGSASGAASSALGALRQFGLVDGLRGDVAVSDLAMRILQPMSPTEKDDAIREAVMKPEIFERIISQFGGKLPASDEPVRSFLIRQEGFSTGGAEELIDALRSSMAMIPSKESAVFTTSEPEVLEADPVPTATEIHISPTTPKGLGLGELISLPLGQNCRAELRLIGEVTEASYARLIKHLELLREIASEDD